MAIRPVPQVSHGQSVNDANDQPTSQSAHADRFWQPCVEYESHEMSSRDLGRDSEAQPKSRMDNLAQLLRLERYEKRRARDIQARLHQAQLATARTSRLLLIARSAQQTLAECIRCEDKQAFVNLYSTFRNALAESAQIRAGADDQSWSQDEDRPRFPANFVDALPVAQRSTLFELLSTIQGDTSYVADRLSGLTQKELLALLPQRISPRSNESVFESSMRSDPRTSRHLGYIVDAQTDQLVSLESASPLEVLIWSTRNLHKHLRHDTRSQEIWARTAARLVSDQKRGMEKIVPAVIETWADASPWPGKERVESWIGRTLQEGAFLLDQPSRRSFRIRVQGRPDPDSEDEGKAEAFFARAVHSLLDLLADTAGSSAIPETAVSLCRNICTYIPFESQQNSFCNFVLTQWLFKSFVTDAVTLPETYAMATSYYISDIARQRILREVVMRSQKAVYHALHPWKHSLPVSKQIADTVGRIAGRFRQPTGLVAMPHTSREAHDSDCCDRIRPGMLALSPSDVALLIDSLYPQSRSSSCFSHTDHSGLQSSSSSVSGFSLFSTPSSSSTTLAYPSFPAHEEPEALQQDSAKMEEVASLLAAPDVGRPPPIQIDLLRDARSSVEEFIVADRYAMAEQLAFINLDPAETRASTPAMDFADLESPSFPIDEHTRPSCLETEDYDFLKITFKRALLDVQDDGYALLSPIDWNGDSENWLLQVMDRSINVARDLGQFVLAHAHTLALSRYRRILSEHIGQGFLQDVLAELQKEAENSLQRSSVIIDKCEEQLKVVQPTWTLKLGAAQARAFQCGLLRSKMLYIADVRTSAAYDEARSIASALKVMGKPRKPSKARMSPPLRHWSGSKILSTNLHLKTEAQVLEILSASTNHGGPNKLSDDQSTVLVAWLASNQVENLCNGEERLHKLCMEIRKAVDHLTAESSPLWSSTLATPDPGTFTARTGGATVPLSVPATTTSRFDALRWHANASSSSRDNMSTTTLSHPLSTRSSRDFVETRSPTLTSRSSGPFWSPSASEVMSPSSVTSIGSVNGHDIITKQSTSNAKIPRGRDEEVAMTRGLLTSLLLSELTASMFNEGSETDQALWTGLGGEVAAKHFRTLKQHPPHVVPGSPTLHDQFDYAQAFESLVDRFDTCTDPAGKLNIMVEIDTLIGLRQPSSHGISSISAKGQCAQADLQSGKSHDTRTSSQVKVDGFRELFCDRRTRPSTIFRDLQYISALLPSIAAEQSARGNAFWHASLAITGLKKELCTVMVELADSIIAYHSNNRGHGRSASSAQQQRDSATFSSSIRTPPPEDVAKYSMADAAHLLQITAQEGNAVAQRELATLYLTNPELMDHIIAPFARPREVFKEELESKWRKNQDPTRCDPATMCVAHHWMSLSAKGGDALAKEYLKQREEMERLP